MSLIGKPIKELTTEERREYNRLLAERNQKRREGERRANQEREELLRSRFRKAWGHMEALVERLEGDEHSRLIHDGLSDEARRILALWVIAERSASTIQFGTQGIEGSVRLASGLKPAQFAKMVAALETVGALVPNLGGEYLWERLSDQFMHSEEEQRAGRRGDHGWDIDPKGKIVRETVEDAGYLVNSGVASILVPQRGDVGGAGVAPPTECP